MDTLSARAAAVAITAIGLVSVSALAQVVAVPGGEGTLGLDGTIDKLYRATHRAARAYGTTLSARDIVDPQKKVSAPVGAQPFLRSLAGHVQATAAR